MNPAPPHSKKLSPPDTTQKIADQARNGGYSATAFETAPRHAKGVFDLL
jgi:hypothetical protein